MSLCRYLLGMQESPCMYSHTYIYICVCVSICVCIHKLCRTGCKQIHESICIYVCIHTCVNADIHTCCVHVNMFEGRQIYMNMYVLMCV